MHKTTTLWAHLSFYFLVNAGAFYFLLLPNQSLAGKWIVALFVLCCFFLFSAHFYVFSKKNTPLAVRLAGRCRKLESELKKERESGLQKTRFIKKAYHEIGSQFWGISTISKLLINGGQRHGVNNLNQMLGDLSIGCHNLKLLLSNVLDYARYESGMPEMPEYESMNISQALFQLVDLARYGAFEKNIRIEFSAAAGVPDRAACDRKMFNQVMTNLINNAIKFSDPYTTIFITLQKDDDQWRISIKDQGRGISSALLPHVFELFYTTKNNEGMSGLGLGLYVSRQLVAAMDGEITVKTKKNAGSCFTVSLPILPVECESLCQKEY